MNVQMKFHLEVQKFNLITFSFSNQSVQPPKACYQSVVIPLKTMGLDSVMGPPSEQYAPIGSAMRLGHRNSMCHLVVPPDEPSRELSPTSLTWDMVSYTTIF